MSWCSYLEAKAIVARVQAVEGLPPAVAQDLRRLAWLVSGDTDSSSEAIFKHMTGAATRRLQGWEPLKVTQAHALKLVWPQPGAPADAPESFLDPRLYQWGQLFLQPLSGPRSTQNRQACVDYVLEHPWWRLSLQTHKLLGIP